MPELEARGALDTDQGAQLTSLRHCV